MRIIPKDFYSRHAMDIFESSAIALATATFAIIGVYKMLGYPFMLQAFVIAMIAYYRGLQEHTERAIREIIEEKKDKSPATQKIEKVNYYKKHHILFKVRSFGVLSLVALLTSFWLLWYFPSETEREKEQSNAIQFQLLMEKLGSMDSSLSILRDSVPPKTTPNETHGNVMRNQSHRPTTVVSQKHHVQPKHH